MATGNTVIMSVKILLMSTGFLFLAILLSLILPQLVTAASAEVPALLTAVKSWLRPPYLYFIINGIIITIVASSKLYDSNHHAPPTESVTHAPPQASKDLSAHHDVISVPASDQFVYDGGAMAKDVDVVFDEDRDNNNVIGVRSDYYAAVSVGEVGVVEAEEREIREVCDEVEDVKEMMVPSLTRNSLEFEIPAVAAAAGSVIEAEKFMKWTPSPPVPLKLKRQEAVADFFGERPPAVSRFGHHRRPTKAVPTEGGKALRRIAKPTKKHDTLESTWKTITEGRHIPLTRHLKKSDTWENQEHHQIDLLDDSFPLPVQEVKKSQTFADRTNYTSPSSAVSAFTNKLKKEPSLGQDELNRRVEAFINKFNEDMKLQRQQSMQQFMEMINRAA